MRKVLSYPNFEMENELYLKIALLYFEELSTIVPKRVITNLSKNHKYISNSTNLLSTYNPRMRDSHVATNKTIRKLDEISLNNQYYRNNNQMWRNSELYSVEIYSEKYSIDLVDYLRRHEFCLESKNGIIVHKDIASFFMTYLAFEIRNTNQMNIICDDKIKSSLQVNFEDTIRHDQDNIELLGVTKLLKATIPRKILDISLDEIIKLRNSNGYLKNLREFHLLVEKYNSNYVLDHFRLLSISREIEEAKKEIGIGRIITSSSGVLTFLLASIYAIKNPGLGPEELTALASAGTFIGNEINNYYSRQLDPKAMGANSFISSIREL